MRILLLLFIVVPIVEMWLLITVGQHIGAIPTIGLVLLTAFIGVSLLRYQGAITLLKARAKLSTGELPAREMADGLFFAVGGALLLTPGFVTDVIGFACLTPGLRTVLIRFFAQHLFNGQIKGRNTRYTSYSQTTHRESSVNYTDSSTQSTRVIEGDFEHHKD